MMSNVRPTENAARDHLWGKGLKNELNISEIK